MLNNTTRYRPHNKIFSFIGGFVFQFKKEFFMLFLSAIAYSICQTLFPIFIKHIINSLYNDNNFGKPLDSHLKITMLLLLTTWVGMQFIINIQGFFIYITMPKLKARIKEDLFKLILRFNHDFFVKNNTDSISQKINNIARSCERILQLFIFNFISIATFFLLVLIIQACLAIHFFIITMIWFFSHFITTYVFLKSAIKLEENYSEKSIHSSGFVFDIIKNILSIKIYNTFNHEFLNMRWFQENEKNAYKKAILIFERMKFIQSTLAAGFIGTTIYYLMIQLNNASITPGDFAMILMITFSLTNIVWQTFNQCVMFAREFGALKNGLSLIDKEYLNYDQMPINENHQYLIQLNNVNFYYGNSKQILNNINLKITQYQKIGIKGQSGAGKTTLLKIILGLLEPSSGHVTINGYNIYDEDKRDGYLDILSQDTLLLNRSIMDNIRYGRPEASIDEVRNAARLACCDDFIKKLDLGYEMVVGENGLKLSGGQKQRIALARMILTNSKIIIMDEPTSSLDYNTEKSISHNLKSFFSDKTVIIISHRNTLFSLVDEVYEFKNGQLNQMK